MSLSRHYQWSDEADFLSWPKDDVTNVIKDMKRERAAVKLAVLAMRLQGKFKPPKKGKTDKKAAPLAKEVKEAAKELEGGKLRWRVHQRRCDQLLRCF